MCLWLLNAVVLSFFPHDFNSFALFLTSCKSLASRTTAGITATQLDVKHHGRIPLDVLFDAMGAAK